MERREVTASCAICGGPGEPECPCEGRRLEIAIEQAEKRWIESWISRTREWVTNASVAYITSAFNRLRSIRIANHTAYLRQLPYWPLWEQYRGRPPLHPHIIAQLQRQIADADADLKRGIDADWKACVIRYPEVLAHFYAAVAVTLPKASDVQMPNLIGLSPVAAGIPAPQLLTGGAGVTVPAQPPLHRSQTAPPKQDKRERRNSHADMMHAHAEAVRLKEALAAAASRPVKPKRSESHRLSMSHTHRRSTDLDRDFLRGMDEDLGDLHLHKTNTNGTTSTKASRKGRSTPAPPTSVTGDAASRRKRRDSAQYLSGSGASSKGAPPAVPSAPSIWDQLPGVLGGTGVRSSFGGIAF